MSAIKNIVIIGGSAGSLQAIFAILNTLKPGFDLPVIFVLHRTSSTDSNLQDLLSVKTHLKVMEIEEKETIQNGYLYICPADYHVLIETNETFSLDASEKVNFSRPSLDVVFNSAAEVFTTRLTAILLSGANADGVTGLETIKESGGITIVQDPLDAVVSHMPEQALKKFKPSYVLPATQIASILNAI